MGPFGALVGTGFGGFPHETDLLAVLLRFIDHLLHARLLAHFHFVAGSTHPGTLAFFLLFEARELALVAAGFLLAHWALLVAQVLEGTLGLAAPGFAFTQALGGMLRGPPAPLMTICVAASLDGGMALAALAFATASGAGL
jgi:hypothetical protein